ncbi:MAG: hypothetical protein NTY19_03685 [Planctomycetota bacterium]|nr:hypothetical protein [Planctomycetota bacterium]
MWILDPAAATLGSPRILASAVKVDPYNPQETTMAKKPAPADVLAAIAQLREYHQKGKQLLGTHKKRSRRWGDMQAVCKQERLLAHQVRALRRFATTYTKKDLEQLCRQCEQHNRAIGLTVVGHLIKIRDKGKRVQFQKRLISERWSNVRIVAELKRARRPTGTGGRKPDVAQDVPGVLLQLEGFAVSWRRWSDRLADQKDKGVKIRLTDLPGKIQNAMAEVTKAFNVISPPPPQQPQQQQEKSGGEDQAVTRRRR